MFRFAIPRLPSISRSALAGPSSAKHIGTSVAQRARGFEDDDSSEMGTLAAAIEQRAPIPGADGSDINPEKLRKFHADRPYMPSELGTGAREAQPRIKRAPPRLGPRKRIAMRTDPFYLNAIEPMNEWQNAELLSDFLLETGMIKKRAESRLTWRSQRMVAKAVRRAKALGYLPTWSRGSDLFKKTGPTLNQQQ
ncbi:hypothetical protein CALVIDRAFT_49259 [Calocera viscosa TUFC12733]|uniref:Small ribosomal subunit protein bS18m n=1 Tax=Calocera viscosa (strain TUFC12733) TaxID=1330018 RepID=A0A167NQW0_CALVF|nr:hypothetical protein CALVIDRAFT_49259 [Calocera viscosa TUFC12733]